MFGDVERRAGDAPDPHRPRREAGGAQAGRGASEAVADEEAAADDGPPSDDANDADLLALDEALDNLAKLDARKSRVVEMR